MLLSLHRFAVLKICEAEVTMHSINHQKLIIKGLQSALKHTPDTPEFAHQRERYREILVIKLIIVNSELINEGDRRTYVPTDYDSIKEAVVSSLGEEISDDYLKLRIEQVKSRKWLGRQRLVTRLKKPTE